MEQSDDDLLRHSQFIGALPPPVAEALDELDRRNAAGRIWARDHTLWKPNPTEIADRLGWLDIAGDMANQVPELEAFAEEVRAEGCQHVALLGMGGSSLGMEVLARILGSAPGFPQLLVLDSVLPSTVQQVSQVIDPSRTLFVAASKSGGTVETLSLYRHFRQSTEQIAGKSQAGRRFVAITDPKTPLDALGREHQFRKVFLNPPDIGGRYSVLSLFGLVPAALMGINLHALLGRAQSMQARCAAGIPLAKNPGIWLGAALGGLARRGRDKLTLAASPSLSSFGLWAQQLIAESTGKEGKGIVPIANEPLAAPQHYGRDRVFVYARLAGDDNSALDSALEKIAAAGHPVLRLTWQDKMDLGGEFYRWEFATAVAGALLGVNPFDQPDVQSAKDTTDQALAAYSRSGRLPDAATGGSLRSFLGNAPQGSYWRRWPT